MSGLPLRPADRTVAASLSQRGGADSSAFGIAGVTKLWQCHHRHNGSEHRHHHECRKRQCFAVEGQCHRSWLLGHGSRASADASSRPSHFVFGRLRAWRNRQRVGKRFGCEQHDQFADEHLAFGSGVAPPSHKVTLSWTPSSSSFSGFNVYRSTVSGGPYTKLDSSIITTDSYTDASITNGPTYYYVATEVDTSGNESAYSTQVSATIP